MSRDLELIRAAHARLFAVVDGLTDEVVARPSLLPGWTVGHVLTHLARHADSVTRRLSGAARGLVVEQYPGGPEGRRAEIEAGAGRTAPEILGDLHAACTEVEAAVGRTPPEALGEPVGSVDGDPVPALQAVRSRVREVYVHLVDLDLGYGPEDWPADFVAAELAQELPRLVERAASPAALFAWSIGRAGAPELRPWR